MPIVLVKREDGKAFISETEWHPSFDYWEGGSALSPDDIVDGKRVSDWPAGVHTVTDVTFSATGQKKRRLTSEQMTRILLEVTNGSEPPLHESDEASNFRKKMRSQVDAIRANGGGVEIAAEWPTLSGTAERLSDWSKETLEIDRG